MSGHSGSRIDSSSTRESLEIARENERCNNSLKNRAPNRARAQFSSDTLQHPANDAYARIVLAWQNMQADAQSLLRDAEQISQFVEIEPLPSVRSAWADLQSSIENMVAEIVSKPARTTDTPSQ